MADYNSAYTGAQIDANLAKAATAVQPASLATVATSGGYDDLTGKPTLATVAGTGAYSDLTGKPTLGTAAATASTDYATAAQGALAATAVQPGANANVLGSGSATDNFVLTANGSGGVAWEAAAGGSSVTDYLRTRLGTVQDVFNMADTWNASGTTFTGIKLNVTDTASAAGSSLLDLQVGGSSKFSVTKAGQFSIGQVGASQALLSSNGPVMSFASNFINTFSTGVVFLNGANQSAVQVGGVLCLGSTGSSADLILARDAANTLAQRNGTAAQTKRLYGTFTDAANYERGYFTTDANGLTIGHEALGTGTKRPVRIVGSALAAAETVPILDMAQTWNTTGVTTAIKMNITNTASGAASRFMDFQIGGTSRVFIGAGDYINGGEIRFGGGAGTGRIEGNGQFGLRMAWTGSGGYFITLDQFGANIGTGSNSTYLAADAANVFAQRNGVAAQTYRLYGTFTDASNYRRLTKTMSTAGVAEIKPEGAGTGAAGNVLHISGLPTSNPGPGILWNNAGTPAIGT